MKVGSCQLKNGEKGDEAIQTFALDMIQTILENVKFDYEKIR